ncbi:hypothetical protein [Marinomonas pollencensis]|nr:hypothetical protein [Marinomonas pollencensis]
MGDVACKRTFPQARNVGGSANRTNWQLALDRKRSHVMGTRSENDTLN